MAVEYCDLAGCPGAHDDEPCRRCDPNPAIPVGSEADEIEAVRLALWRALDRPPDMLEVARFRAQLSKRGRAVSGPVGSEARCPTCRGNAEVENPAMRSILGPWTNPPTIACPDCQGTGQERVISERALREWIATVTEMIRSDRWRYHDALRDLTSWLDEQTGEGKP